MKNDLTEKGMLVTVFWFPIVNVIMYIGLLISFFGSLKKTDLAVKKTVLDYTVIIFTAVIFISMLVSVDKVLSIYGFMAFCAYPIAYFIFSKNLTEENLSKIISLFIFSAAIVVMVAGIQFLIPGLFLYRNRGFFGLLGWDTGLPVWKGARLVSTLGNSNVFGSYLVLILPFLFCLFLRKPSFKIGAISIAGVICLFFTYSRAAWIGFFVAMLAIFILSKKRFLVLICLLFLLPFTVIPGLGDRFKSIANLSYVSGAFGRFSVWQTSLDIIRKYPLFGIGVNTFYKIYPVFRPGGSADGFAHAHNIFLQLGAETGFLGLSTFCLLLFLFFRSSWKTYKKSVLLMDVYGFQWIILGIIGSTAGFIIQNLGDCTLIRGQLGVFFFSLMGIIKGLENLLT